MKSVRGFAYSRAIPSRVEAAEAEAGMNAILSYVVARLAERSTLIGLVQVCAGALGYALTPETTLAIAAILGGAAQALVPDGTVRLPGAAA